MIPMITDEQVASALTIDRAFDVVTASFVSAWRGSGRNFPVVRESIGDAGAVFGVKSGCDSANGLLGLKAGGYWPGNEKLGVKNHQSTLIMFDPGTGQPTALLAANVLTALRTGAAAAISVDRLARKDARVLGVIGAGRQAAYQIRAIIRTRRFDRLLVWNRTASRIAALADTLGDSVPPIEALPLERICQEADVLVTLMSAREPIVLSDWVRPGQHISGMGTDTRGKQEMDPMLFVRARVFTDDVNQAITIGESQHPFTKKLMERETISHLGAVIDGFNPGRISESDITLYDGTGTILQDLASAAAVLDFTQLQ